MSENGYVKVAFLGELPEGMPVAFGLESGEGVCLIKVKGEVFACEDRCSHADFPLSEGDMADDYVIECALHGAQFDVRTGEVLEEPASEKLRTYSVKVVGDEVFVCPPEDET